MKSKIICILWLILVFLKQGNSKMMKHELSMQPIPQKLFAAELHYARIPHEYWEHRIRMIKAMGFNALSVYVMWNFHQIQKGSFDYQSPQKNIKNFLDLTKKHELKVLFRPGPYVCAQWDFGGLPARLLSREDLQIRANNQNFLEQVEIYFESLASIIKQYHLTKGGTIIMLQIQNQYGFYGEDKSYIQALRGIWKKLGVELPEYYVDWIQNISKCHWEGANIGINNAIRQLEWQITRQIEPKGLLFGGQIYSGWLTHWGQQWQGKSLKQYTDQFSFLMNKNHSFSMYMAHGGTNFGLYAGANGFDSKSFDYGGHVTSYDYDAPINQQGSPTQKYHIFRQLAKKHATWDIPEIPQSLPMIEISPFIPSGFADIFSNLPIPTIQKTSELVTFEDDRLRMWQQGFVLYETVLEQNGKYLINITVHDFALIFVNGVFSMSLDRGQRSNHQIQLISPKKGSILKVLVQAMGHINFGSQMTTDFKGLISFQNTNNSNQKFEWKITAIPITPQMLKWDQKQKGSFPRLFRYNLTLKWTGDTYLNMKGWQKGYVFFNGQNLGRYWDKGPQTKLFLPGAWMRKGVNDVVVLELMSSNAKFIRGEKTLTQLMNQTRKATEEKKTKLWILQKELLDK